MAAKGISFGRGSDEWSRIKDNKRIFTLNGIICNHLDLCVLHDCTCKDIYGEMFETQCFLHETWHQLQEEEYKDQMLNFPKGTSILPSQDTFKQFNVGKYKSPKKVPTIRPSDDVSQNIEEINSMIRHMNTVANLQSQYLGDGGRSNTKEIEESNHQRQQFGIKVEKTGPESEKTANKIYQLDK